MPFNDCAPSGTISGTLTPQDQFDSTSVISYSVSMTMQENVPTDAAPQEVDFTGTASADGTKMSGNYMVPPGGCSTGDSGVWTASKN